MNIAIWEGLTDNKIEIIYFMVNTRHKFVVYDLNVEIQKVTAYTSFQYLLVVIDIFCKCTKILQIHCAYIYCLDIGNCMTTFLPKCNQFSLI